VRIAVIGGGPGVLYFANLWKRRHPDAKIDLFEQNAAGATWGFRCSHRHLMDAELTKCADAAGICC